MNNKITLDEAKAFLIADGVKSYVRGFDYIAVALSEYNTSDPIIKTTYFGIAKKFSTTSTRVERCIRSAIQNTRNKVLKLDHEVTNSEYLSLARLKILGEGETFGKNRAESFKESVSSEQTESDNKITYTEPYTRIVLRPGESVHIVDETGAVKVVVLGDVNE